MKPTAENLPQWFNDLIRREYPDKKTYTQSDLDALDECLSIFLGNGLIKDKIDELEDYKELESLFYRGDISLASNGYEDYLINGQTGKAFRESLIGYRCAKDFEVCSLKPELREYIFEIWHDYHNTQIMVSHKDDMHRIRIMWHDLFKVIYEFYSTKTKTKQLNLFDFAA